MWKLVISHECAASLGSIPHFKLVDPVSIISAGVPVVTSLIGGLFGKSSADKQNAMNIQMQRETNELNKQMFYDNLRQQQNQFMLSNKFNAEQAALAREEGNAFTREMFNLENQYNSPRMQMQRYLGAGLNPSVAMSGNVSHAGNASANFAPNGTSATASSLGLPSSPMLQAPQATINPIQNIQVITDAIGKAADAFTKLDSHPLMKKNLQAQWEKALSEIEFNEQFAKEKELANNLTAIFGFAKNQHEVDILGQTLKNLISEGDIKEKQKILLDLEKRFKELEIDIKEPQAAAAYTAFELLLQNLEADYRNKEANTRYVNTQNQYYPTHIQNETRQANAAERQANAAEINAFSNREVNHALAGLYGVQATRTSCLKALDDSEIAYKGALREVAENQRDVLREQIPIIQQAADEAISRGKYTDAAALFSVIGTLIQGSVSVKVP